MSEFPRSVIINEEGPREGFQIEPGPVAIADKVGFIEALAETGLRTIDCVSFVNPKRVPQMADAEDVAAAITKREGVTYTGLWLNTAGLERALATPLDVIGAIRVTASEPFALANTRMTKAETHAEQRRWLERYREAGVSTKWGYVMTAFGCNYQGEVPVTDVVEMVADVLDLADTAGFASPASTSA